MPFDEVPNAILPLFQNPRLVWSGMQIGQRTVRQRAILQGTVLPRIVWQGLHIFRQMEESDKKLMLPTIERADHSGLISFCCEELDSDP